MNLKNICITGLMLMLFSAVNAQDSNPFSIWVNGRCEMCKDRIEETALAVSGVDKADYNLEKKSLKITYFPGIFSIEDLHVQLAAVGHDTEKATADDAIYNALPLCCLYRETTTVVTAEKKTTSSGNSKSYWVGGRCEMCTDRIVETALAVSGVESAEYDLGSNTLEVTTFPGIFSEMDLHVALANAGHDTEHKKADDKIYKGLPLCCDYRESPPQKMADQSKYVVKNLPNENEQKLWVGGCCAGCGKTIVETAEKVRGVKKATYDYKTMELSIETKKGFNEAKLHERLAAAGHDTKLAQAPDDAYFALEECCQYRVLINAPISGKVITMETDQEEPLIGANVFWADATGSTITDGEGNFELEKGPDDHQLIISYVGYKNDTIEINKAGTIEIRLNPAAYLDEVEIKGRKRSSEVSYLSPQKVLQVSKTELTKAACCSLAESFQTTPAVDESFSDAVTGTRTIEMLGLASPYIQITRENIPEVRGLSALHGLDFTPGPWIDGIQLSQGSGSVVNGYESITGQINVNLFHPESEEKLYFNAYANEGGRYEANLTSRHRVTDNTSTAFLLHSSTRTQQHDRNKDGFLDMPLSKQFLGINRWKFRSNSGWEGQAGFKASINEYEAGQKSFFSGVDNGAWNSNLQNNQYVVWTKTGVVFNENKSSFGLQMNYTFHDLDSHFGLRRYNGVQKSWYSNLIFQHLLGEGGSDLKAGLTFTMDDVKEELQVHDFERSENVIGAYAEGTYQQDEFFTIVGGIRYDHHNKFGGFITPRAHLRYAPSESTVFRLSAGRGVRTASIFSENLGGMASSRAFTIRYPNGTVDIPDTPYGLTQEKAWNFGVNVQQEWNINGKRASLGVDYFHTRFTDQVVVDYDENHDALLFYNLEGNSYSHSLQFLFELNPIDRLDIRLAYRMNDVQVDYLSEQRERPLIAKHRGFFNIAYATANNWKFDYTFNIIGNKRIPGTRTTAESYSPSYSLSNLQLSKEWNKKYEVYLGVENVFNYQQENPILAADRPFSTDFDAALVWGPIFGRNVYTGIRYKIFE